jgi:fumarate reductase subunit C
VELRAGGKRLPDRLLAAGSFAVWALVSVAIAWILIGG